MMFYKETVREKIITVGTLIACAIIFALAAEMAFFYGGYAVIFSVLLISVPVMIFMGIKFGYSLAKFIIGALAVVIFGAALGPFVFSDFSFSGKSYSLFVMAALFGGFLLLFTFYSLQEHQKYNKSGSA